MMRVLWFEITTPSQYENSGMVLGGWQDALEKVIREDDQIELYVAFPSKIKKEPRIIDGVNYIPLFMGFSFWDKCRDLFSWSVFQEKLITQSLHAIDKIKPDVIHVFGTEYPYGLISNQVSIPVVIHIQGAIIPYNNAYFPPGYNNLSMFFLQFPNVVKQAYVWVKWKKEKSRVKLEDRIWKTVPNYMGRTTWDKALVSCNNPKANYYHVDEVLRPVFYHTSERWHLMISDKIKLLTIGIGTFWKGPDLILKTSRILKQLNVDFVWTVAGEIRNDVKTVVEKNEALSYKANNVNILGFVNAEDLIQFIISSTMVVHTAYIDNSPNSICEAQLLGAPIVSTMVGGIDSLIENGHNGILVPANDPWRLAYEIIMLANNRERMEYLSKNAQMTASKRHDRDSIKNQLFNCYYSLVNRDENI